MKLALFFTRNVSLKYWARNGNLDRELALYRELKKHFDEITFLTYGLGEPETPGFKIAHISNWKRIAKEVDILKTNQMSGSPNAVLAKIFFKKKLVVRQGYQWSFFEKRKRTSLLRRFLVGIVERTSYALADAIIVSSRSDKEYIKEKYGISEKKINYIPNYIDTERFKPLKLKKKGILTVAKLELQKNLENLIEAVRGLDVNLTIIGQGSLEQKLRKIAPRNVNFIPSVPNEELPKIINKSEIFILSSNFEGCPKALLEAMACEVPVIGTSVPGIEEIIEDGVNGYLCSVDKDSIKNKIKEVSKLKKPVSGRKTILDNFSLASVVLKETALYDSIL